LEQQIVSTDKVFPSDVRLGFLVNPVAGMGGAVGLKGTDGERILREAISKGARKVAPDRAVAALSDLKEMRLDVQFLTCAGEMGKDELDSAGIKGTVVYNPPERSTRSDTQAAVRAFLKEGVELIVFVGGDGTARDIIEVVGQNTAIIGVPAGVKMHSAVFANTSDELPGIIAAFLESHRTRDAEVMDIDEESFRRGVLSAKLYGMAKIPDDPVRIQSGKAVYHSGTAAEEALEIAQYIADGMEEGTIYVLGPGSTTAEIAMVLGERKTLLGVDVYLDRKLLREDVDENGLLEVLAGGKPARIVVTPIGSQGFFFGRGNQQISPAVIRKVGTENVIVVATPTKLRGTPVLRVDSGDPELDESFRGRVKVVTGYKRRRLVTVQ
jgi:predicted polyphosphate/ATP-dependent NAD kinase